MNQPQPRKNSPGQSPDALEHSILEGLQVYSFQKNLELLICILVIMVLATLALTQYSSARRKAKVIQTVASHGPVTRTAIHYYHALHGSWPDRAATLALICQLQPGACRADLSVNQPELTAAILAVDDGGVTLDVPGVWADHKQQITLHPAVPVDDPLGPVIWLAGSAERPGWLALGRDRTDATLLPFVPTELQ